MLWIVWAHINCFHKFGGPLGVPIQRALLFRGLYWGPVCCKLPYELGCSLWFGECNMSSRGNDMSENVVDGCYEGCCTGSMSFGFTRSTGLSSYRLLQPKTDPTNLLRAVGKQLN